MTKNNGAVDNCHALLSPSSHLHSLATSYFAPIDLLSHKITTAGAGFTNIFEFTANFGKSCPSGS